MKNLLKSLLIVPAIMVLTSCKQNNIVPDNNLTACPINSTCGSLFTELADVNTQNTLLMPGNYRVFWYEVQTAGLDTKIYVKAPMQGNSFLLNKDDILAGRVLFFQSCPACNLIPLKPIDGYVKGSNSTPGKIADQTHWLLEGKIVLEGVNTPTLKDSVYFKRDFSPNFVYN